MFFVFPGKEDRSILLARENADKPQSSHIPDNRNVKYLRCYERMISLIVDKRGPYGLGYQMVECPDMTASEPLYVQVVLHA